MSRVDLGQRRRVDQPLHPRQLHINRHRQRGRKFAALLLRQLGLYLEVLLHLLVRQPRRLLKYHSRVRQLECLFLHQLGLCLEVLLHLLVRQPRHPLLRPEQPYLLQRCSLQPDLLVRSSPVEFLSPVELSLPVELSSPVECKLSPVELSSPVVCKLSPVEASSLVVRKLAAMMLLFALVLHRALLRVRLLLGAVR